MRLLELNLQAFGPFTERRLLFAADGNQAGLQIVYGPNEAGKSSALRGLKALLYGMDPRSTDDFVHAHPKMRVAGSLRNSAGFELAFTRRKGNKNTVLDAAGDAPLDDMALAPFLQTVTADMFSSLYGIDHAALLRGGQEILEQKGELGRALFSAALGSHDLNAVLKGLDEEADALFKQRGSRQRINAAISQFKENGRQQREQTLRPADWQQKSDALQQTRQQLQQVEDQLAAQRAELARLRRLQRLQPRLADYRRQRIALADLDGVVLLTADFASRRQQAVTAQARAAAVLEGTAPQLKELRHQLGMLEVNQTLLDQADAIVELHIRIGAEAKAHRDRGGLVGERQALLEDAGRLLAEVRPDLARPDLALTDLETLRPLLARRRRIADIGARQAVLDAALQQAQDAQHDAESKLRELQRQQAATGVAADTIPSEQDIDSLNRTILAARREGDVDTHLHKASGELVALQQRCDAAIGRLELGHHPVASLGTLALPNSETISRFEQQSAALDQRRRRLVDAQQQVDSDQRDTAQELDGLQRVGTIPSEADLEQRRAQRDQRWQRLRSRWLDAAVTSEQPPMDELPADATDFEQHMDAADEVADRLRREAGRVQKLAGLEASRDSLAQRAQQLKAELDACTADRQQQDADWRAQWQVQWPKDTRSMLATPTEMRPWLDDFERLREQLPQLARQQREINERQQARERHRLKLQQQLRGLGGTGDADVPGNPDQAAGAAPESLLLEPVLSEREALLQRLQQQAQQQQQMQREQQRLQQLQSDTSAALKRARQALSDWQLQWQQTLSDSGLATDASPAEAEEFVDKLAQLFDKQREATERQRRIDAIDRDSTEFSEQVAALVARIAPDLGGLAAAEAVDALNTQLAHSRSALKQREQIQQQLDKAEQQAKQAGLDADIAKRLLAALATEAACPNSDAALIEAERQSAEKATIKANIAALEQQINEDAAGASLSELEAEADALDSDALPADIARLSDHIEDELEPRRTALAETAGGQQQEIGQMDGSARAAELAEQGQGILAGIRADSERYVRVKLAARILRDQIERYRRDNQGPVVQRASEHFAALTLGSFERLTIDFNDRDQAVLAGVRPDDTRIHVDGMSTGTRDQLYLALRLASLEKTIRGAEPMPFIVDDVLVDFDDQRSVAALQTLAELAGLTQVVLFTHHARLVEQAQQLTPAAHIHTL